MMKKVSIAMILCCIFFLSACAGSKSDESAMVEDAMVEDAMVEGAMVEDAMTEDVAIENADLNAKSARELFREYANDAIEQGYNVKYDMDRNAISYLELSEYTVNGDSFVLSPDIYVLDDEMGFALVFEHLESDEVYSVKINEVEFNSTYIYAFGYDNDCFATVELEGIMSGMNEKKYQECFNAFDTSDKITITLNSDFSFELTEYDVEQLRCYFDIYNNIKLICK